MRSVLAAALLCVAASPARADDLRIPIDESFARFSVDWSGQDRTSTAYWTVIAIEEHLAACGLIQHHVATYRQHNSAALRRGTILVGGKVVLEGLQFFTEIGSDDKPEQALATCRAIPGPLPPREARIELDIPGEWARF